LTKRMILTLANRTVADVVRTVVEIRFAVSQKQLLGRHLGKRHHDEWKMRVDIVITVTIEIPRFITNAISDSDEVTDGLVADPDQVGRRGVCRTHVLGAEPRSRRWKLVRVPRSSGLVETNEKRLVFLVDLLDDALGTIESLDSAASPLLTTLFRNGNNNTGTES